MCAGDIRKLLLSESMNPNEALGKAVELLRAAGDDEAASALLASSTMQADTTPLAPPEPVVVVVTEGDEPAGADASSAGSEPSPLDVIAAQAAADVAVIEAQADAAVVVIEAQAAADAVPAVEVDVEVEAPDEPVVLDEAADDPEPRQAHWYYRRRFGR